MAGPLNHAGPGVAYPSYPTLSTGLALTACQQPTLRDVQRTAAWHVVTRSSDIRADLFLADRS